MRILLTVHQFFPDFAAGTEVLTRAVARELVARGHEVRVLSGCPSSQVLTDAQRCDHYVVENFHVYRFHHAYVPMGGQNSVLALGYDNHLAADYFERILAAYQPDVVHFFHLNRLGTGLIERAVRACIPSYLTPTDFWTVCPTGQLLLGNSTHCLGPDADGRNCVQHFAQNSKTGLAGAAVQWMPRGLLSWLIRQTRAGRLPAYAQQEDVIATSVRLSVNVSRLNQLSGIAAPNVFMRDLLVRHGVDPALITLAGFGIELACTSATLPRAAPRKPFRFGFVGTLGPHKGCHVLIEAFKKLPQGAAVLAIYGNETDFPAYAADLHRLAEGCATITFEGVFPNAQIDAVLHAVDALVVPSLWFENTPLVVFSAQASLCPVVASDLPGLSDAVQHGVNGLLFAVGSVSALAMQLQRLTDERGLAAQLGDNARCPKSTVSYVDELLTLWTTEPVAGLL